MTQDEGSGRRFSSDLTMSGRSEVRGFVYDPDDLSARFVVEVLADGLPVGILRADAYVDGLARGGVGDGCYGFVLVLPEPVMAGAETLEARLANSGERVGPLLRPGASGLRGEPDQDGQVNWVGGLRFEGWVIERPGRTLPRIKAIVEGQVVQEVVPTGWAHVDRGGGYAIGRVFRIDLPSIFADGKARQVEVLAGDGTKLAGSPCACVGFADGLESFIDSRAGLDSEKMRARYFDRLIPQSWPFCAFDEWQARFPDPRPEGPSADPVAVVLIGESEIEASLESLRSQELCAWTAACLPDAGRATFFNPPDLLDFLAGEAARCEIVVLAPAGTMLSASALGLFRDALAANPSSASVYCDLVTRSEGEIWPMAWPAFDRERCLEQGYCGLVYAMRAASVAAAARSGANSLLRLFNGQFDAPLAKGAEPLHIPLLLASPPPIPAADLRAALAEAAGAHFRSMRRMARVSPSADPSLAAVRVSRNLVPGRVTIIIPTRNRPDLLGTCLASLDTTLGDTDHEIVIADNDSTDEQALAIMYRAERQGARVVRVPGEFNFSRINNRAVASATGRYLLLLNNDVEALEPGWLHEMLSRMAEPDVGAVGPLLLWPSGVVQHAGVVLGPNFAAAHAFDDRLVGDAGYGGLLQVAHECSAVTGACLLTRRDLYLNHGGLDEIRFAIDFNDVDYCLKLRASGYRVVVTPYAKLRHNESSTRGRVPRPGQWGRAQRELANLRSKWGEVLSADPYYSPALTLNGAPYSGLAWPPRARAPRQPGRRPARQLPSGL